MMSWRRALSVASPLRNLEARMKVNLALDATDGLRSCGCAMLLAGGRSMLLPQPIVVAATLFQTKVNYKWGTHVV